MAAGVSPNRPSLLLVAIIFAQGVVIFWLLALPRENEVELLTSSLTRQPQQPPNVVSQSPNNATGLPGKPLLSQGEMDRFMSTFRAHDSAYQAWCLRALQHGSPGQQTQGSQFGQDVFVFRNLFLDMAMRQQKGFYVESGANHWSVLSNTFFFDKCLGWDGLCVEPVVKYHDDLRRKRSCKLVPECISDKHETLMLSDHEGTNAETLKGTGAAGAKAHPILCRPLHEMLADVDRRHVDFWVLDVEGFEMTILKSIRWDLLSFGAVMVEDNKIWNRRLDYLMSMKGYAKFHQMAIDSLFTPRQHHRPLWYPGLWYSYEALPEMTKEQIR